jgi:hypothetical protein
MKNKIKFGLNGITFEIPATCLKTTDYWGVPLANPTISIGRKEIPLIAKQFIKAKYPNLLVWGSSSVFANGNSADIYVCNPDGSEMDWDSVEFRTIKSFIENLRGGRYNGMEDIYEYAEWGTTDTGTALDFGAKYITVNPKAPHGSWPSAIKTLKGLIAGEYVFGVLSLEKAIEKAKTYGYSDSTISKAIAEMA